MKKNEKHTKFVLTDELISKILDFINSSDDNSILETFSNYHHADIAEIIEELNSEEATYIIKLLDSEKTSDVLMELDDEYRENEGDLVIPASNVSPKKINFMAKYGRGLICLALTSKQAKRLNLSLMSPINKSRNQTAFH